MVALNVIVAASVDDGPLLQETATVTIPPDYTEQDTRALTARVVEDTAFALTQREFGRARTRAALVAATARVRGIRLLLDDGDEPDVDVLRQRIRDIIELSNDEATALYGEEPEGI